MGRYFKAILGIIALYAGLALLPYVHLPYAKLDWEIYADAYLPTATQTSTPTRTFTPAATYTPSATYTPTSTGVVPPTDTSTPTATGLTPIATSTATPTLPPGIVVMISPSVRIATVGEIFILDILILAGAQPIDGIQAHLDFNPMYLNVVDAGGVPTNQIIPGAAFPAIFENVADNALGRIDYRVGAPSPPLPTGNILAGQIRLKALSPVGGTSIAFSLISPRRSKVVHGGAELAASWISGVVSILPGAPTATPTTAGGTVYGSVDLQSRPPRPHPAWQVPLRVTFLAGGYPVYVFTPTTNSSGSFVVGGIAPGIYDIRVKNMHTLSNRKIGVPILAGDNSVYLGTLIEGDASDDDVIDILDFSILRTVFGTNDPRADFNQDGIVDILDFSILRTNFGRTGEIVITAEAEKLP